MYNLEYDQLSLKPNSFSASRAPRAQPVFAVRSVTERWRSKWNSSLKWLNSHCKKQQHISCAASLGSLCKLWAPTDVMNIQMTWLIITVNIYRKKNLYNSAKKRKFLKNVLCAGFVFWTNLGRGGHWQSLFMIFIKKVQKWAAEKNTQWQQDTEDADSSWAGKSLSVQWRQRLGNNRARGWRGSEAHSTQNTGEHWEVMVRANTKNMPHEKTTKTLETIEITIRENTPERCRTTRNNLAQEWSHNQVWRGWLLVIEHRCASPARDQKGESDQPRLLPHTHTCMHAHTAGKRTQRGRGDMTEWHKQHKKRLWVWIQVRLSNIKRSLGLIPGLDRAFCVEFACCPVSVWVSSRSSSFLPPSKLAC